MFILVLIALWVALVLNAYMFYRSRRYDGIILINKNPNGQTQFSLDVRINPDDIQSMDRVIFKVNKDVFEQEGFFAE